jgi:predicted RNase H-like HicB family nuclease
MNLEYKMNVNFNRTENIYIGKIDEFPGFIATGKNINELILDAKSAKIAWIDTALSLDREIAEPNNIIETIAI